MLLLHLIFLQNLLLFISSISVGRGKLQKERHSVGRNAKTSYSTQLKYVITNDNVSMSVGPTDHVFNQSINQS